MSFLYILYIFIVSTSLYAYFDSQTDPGEKPDNKDYSRVMLIDDNLKQTAHMSKMLKVNGFISLPITTSYSDAVRYYQLNHSRIDLIALDLSFNNYRGLDIIKKILRMNRNATIIVICDEEKRSLLSEALSAGARMYVYKPLEEKVFLTKVFMGLFEY